MDVKLNGKLFSSVAVPPGKQILLRIRLREIAGNKNPFDYMTTARMLDLWNNHTTPETSQKDNGCADGYIRDPQCVEAAKGDKFVLKQCLCVDATDITWMIGNCDVGTNSR